MQIRINGFAIVFAALVFAGVPAHGAEDRSMARAYSNSSAFGNFLRPFAATSPWNSKPIDPVFDTFQIPKNDYFPVVGAGPLSTGVFEAKATDPPLTIYKDPKSKYIRDVDAEQDKESITIPRWPADAVPASGGDGQCDVVDSVTGIVHSFCNYASNPMVAGRPCSTLGPESTAMAGAMLRTITKAHAPRRRRP